jgi:hypothetical protein
MANERAICKLPMDYSLLGSNLTRRNSGDDRRTNKDQTRIQFSDIWWQSACAGGRQAEQASMPMVVGSGDESGAEECGC